MTFLITPTTELEAVNECLENIGQAPANTISGEIGVDAQVALNFVRKCNRELQSAGWYWNTEKNYPLIPNATGDIILPSNTLAVDADGDSKARDVTQRGRRLYDRANHTYRFTDTVYVYLTVGLTFEELPETARRYIALRSARLFQDRIEGVATSGDSADEANAVAVLHADQLRVEDSNILTDSYSIASTLRRHY